MENLLQEYVEYLRFVRRVSENTVIAYQTDVAQFLQFLREKGTPLNSFGVKDGEDYLKQISKDRDQPMSISTLARKISSLRNFFDYLVLRNYVPNNPWTRVKSPRLRKRMPDFLTREEVGAMLRVSERNERDHLILCLLYYCGLRVSELCNLKVSDVSFSPAFVKILMGKGRKDRIVPLNIDLSNKLRHYITKSQRTMEQFLFGGEVRIHPSTVFRIVRKYASLCGIKKKIHPHTLRHSFATHLLQRKVNVRVVQELLGHANLSTTSTYLHLLDEEKIAAVNSLIEEE
ncbi:site-specific tyrosine recombinase/integron integrase [Pseudothermotoga sp.]|uniref:site-specific tyrosine recombinase/integron integrase n=1 Tax=Pseudothermotoga sp. TaxID=2033661 RepID=UPI0031F62475